MKRFWNKRDRQFGGLGNERGQAAIELMLVFPLFILITLIALDFGIWMYQSVTVANAVREAARYGSVNCPDDGGCSVSALQDRAVEKSNGVLQSADVTAGWVDRLPASAGDKGSSVVVRAEHTYNLTFWQWLSLPVVSCADMRLERDGSASTAGSEC